MKPKPGAAAEGNAPTALQVQMLEKLVLVREFELACEAWWKAGVHLVGEFHLSLGQEAFAVGTCMAARPNDPICPSIRGMGAYLCRDVPMERLIASFLERANGISEGRWAHWHSPVADCHILPQTGMLGSGLVTAVGVAMAHRLAHRPEVVIGMIGDGSTNTGYFHEGVNLAAVKRAPIVIVIENNQYAISTPITSMALVKNLADRAAAYGIPGVSVDGTDVVAVYLAVSEALRRAREGQGPTLVELKAYRWGGQTLKDPDRVRPAEEKAEARTRCPVERMKQRLLDASALTEAGFAAMVQSARERIARAEAQARQFPPIAAPDEAAMLRDYAVYAQ
jgi:pyruvate dehydrogenase E1 component alpha subunit